MARIRIRTLALLLLIGIVAAFGKKETTGTFVYDISGAGSAIQGYYMVKVSAYVPKKALISTDVVIKCAVHGVLFRGFSGGETCPSQKPLAGSTTEEQHSEFFVPFFKDGGGYANYASVIDGSLQVQRMDKKYKVTAIITVDKNRLRSDLERAGVLKGLSSGF